MSKHLERDVQKIEQDLLQMAASVESMIDRAWRSLEERDATLADAVIDSDEEIDRREVHIEEDCLKVLALHQPVAIDLRRTATILKVNNDLERVADLAVNMAERSQRLANAHDFVFPKILRQMADSAMQMLRESLNVFVQLDPDAAILICQADDEVDQCHAEVVAELYQMMRDDAEMIAPSIHCLAVARHLERIADHATNIAEDVIYLVRGDITRHQHQEFSVSQSTKRPSGSR